MIAHLVLNFKNILLTSLYTSNNKSYVIKNKYNFAVYSIGNIHVVLHEANKGIKIKIIIFFIALETLNK